MLCSVGRREGYQDGTMEVGRKELQGGQGSVLGKERMTELSSAPGLLELPACLWAHIKVSQLGRGVFDFSVRKQMFTYPEKTSSQPSFIAEYGMRLYGLCSGKTISVL